MCMKKEISIKSGMLMEAREQNWILFGYLVTKKFKNEFSTDAE